MDTLNIEIAEGKTGFNPGETVKGVANWQLSDNPQELSLSLFWYTDGKGTRDVCIVETIPINLPGSYGERDFSFTLPYGPYSFSGKLISLKWALELSDAKGRRVTQKDITVSPTGNEIILCGPGPQ